MEHIAMVMRDVNADVIGVVEGETRIALDKFSTQLLEKVNGIPNAHVMVIDGNDDRGIDVGVMTRAGYEIASICSHVDDEDEAGSPFERQRGHRDRHQRSPFGALTVPRKMVD
jgi:hypothetical protein